MKKFLSLFLAVLMVASIVALMPVFSVSAAPTDSVGRVETYQVILTKKPIAVAEDSYSAERFNGSVGNLFDNDLNSSKLEGGLNDDTERVYFATDEASTVAYYVLYTGNDTASYKGRNPSKVRFYGSNDEGESKNYTLLDDVTNPGMGNINATPYAFKIDEPAAYKYYKIEFDGKTDTTTAETEAATRDGYFQLNGLVLYSADDKTDAAGWIKDTEAGSITEGRYQIPATLSAGNGHGFVDLNFNTTDSSTNLQKIIGTTDWQNALNQFRFFVNGAEVDINRAYNGTPHSGWNGSGNIFLGIVGGAMTKGEPATVTVLIGDDAYVEGQFNPEVTTLGVTDSATVYASDTNKLYTTVTFASEHGLEVGDLLTLDVHDNHLGQTAKVTEVNGNTVKILVDEFTTTHSLCEFTIQKNGTKFSISIDTKDETIKGYIQLRPNSDNIYKEFDTRILIEGIENYINTFETAKFDITFSYGDGQTKTFTTTNTKSYKKVTAGSETYTALTGYTMLGVSIVDIPNDTYDVSVTLTLKAGDETFTKTFSHNDFNNPYANLEERASSVEQITLGYDRMEKYSEAPIAGEAGPCFTGAGKICEAIYGGGSAVLKIDDQYFKITANEFDDWGMYYARFGATKVGAEFYEGISYKITVYVFDANYNFVAVSDERTVVSTFTTADIDTRLPLTVTLPSTVTTLDGSTFTDLGVSGYKSIFNTEKENVAQLFDATSNNSKLGCHMNNAGDTLTVTFKTPNAQTVTYYTLYTGNDTAKSPQRNPIAWKLYGKVGNDWVVLSSVAYSGTHVIGLGATNNQPYSYEVTNPQSCSEYKIEFVTASDQFQMNGLVLHTGN